MFFINVLFMGPGDFPVSSSNRDTTWISWNRNSGSLTVDTGILFSNMKSHYPWPDTMTSQPIRLSTNFMTLIPSLTFAELWVVSMEHLQWVWHASRERLPFQTSYSIPLFGTCLCSNYWDQISQACHVFTRIFTLKTSWYFSSFCFVITERWLFGVLYIP